MSEALSPSDDGSGWRIGRVPARLLVVLLAALAVLPLLPHLGRRVAGQAVPGQPGVGPMEAATLLLPGAAGTGDRAAAGSVPPAAAWWPGAGREAEWVGLAGLMPRLLSVLMVAVAVAAACRAGAQLGGARAGWLAGSTMLGSPALWAWGRAATPATLQLAASLLAVAGALTAIRPFKPPARRWRLAGGWVTAGLGFAGAALAGGVAAVLPAAAAACVLVVLSPRRLGDAAGLAAAGCLGVLATLPWWLPGDAAGPAGLGGAGGAGAPAVSLFPGAAPPGAGGLAAVGLDLGRALGPWLPLVLGAAVLPFTAQVRRQGTAGRLVHGWSVAAVCVAACLPLAGGWAGPGAALFAAAAVSVAVGQALSAIAESAEAGRRMWLWRVVGVATAVGLVAASVGLAWSPELGGWPVAAAWMPPLAEAGGLSRLGAVTLALLAGLLALASAVPAWGDRPAWAAAGFAAWAWLVLTVLAVAGAPDPAGAV